MESGCRHLQHRSIGILFWRRTSLSIESRVRVAGFRVLFKIPERILKMLGGSGTEGSFGARVHSIRRSLFGKENNLGVERSVNYKFVAVLSLLGFSPGELLMPSYTRCDLEKDLFSSLSVSPLLRLREGQVGQEVRQTTTSSTGVEPFPAKEPEVEVDRILLPIGCTEAAARSVLHVRDTP